MTENAPAHTPGPWAWHVARTMQYLVAPNSERRALGVSMPLPANKAYRCVTGEDAANARLIAAAPDLLAAAKAAWDAIDNLLDLRRERKADTGDAHEAIIEAHGLLGAAIAKATGNNQDIPVPPPAQWSAVTRRLA